MLYTHKLYTDGLGSNSPRVLTSWVKGKLSRPKVNLFPRKFHMGFSSHRFMVAAIEQPPFVLKALSTDTTGNTAIGKLNFFVFFNKITFIDILKHYMLLFFSKIGMVMKFDC